MSKLEIFLSLCVVVLFVLVLLAQRTSYINGVVDGYGYSREPNCPGYKIAGEYLKRYMKHRWRELDE